jgi:O-acetyl-ADP-ribose deacetylase (regulator of RNase III)
MKTVVGDLIQLALNGEFDVIIHGCNCQCVMGKGIALSVKKYSPKRTRQTAVPRKVMIKSSGRFPRQGSCVVRTPFMF